MPTPESIKKSTERREARKRAREQAVETAQTQTATISETTAASKARAAERPSAPATVSRKERVAAERRATEEAVKLQDRTMQVKDSDVDPQTYIRPGATLTLHQLNRLAIKGNRERRDEAREIALIAGAAVEKAARGVRSKHAGGDRHSRLRDADEAMAEVRAKLEGEAK
jgi:hypothetical protein